MEELIDDFYIDELEENQEEEFEFDDYVPKRSVKKGKDVPLVDDDYNLNSPIMTDILHNITDYVLKGLKPHHHINRTERVWKPFKSNNIKVAYCHRIDESYKVIMRYISEASQRNSTYMERQVKIMSSEIDSVKDVADTFVKSMGLDPIEFNVQDKILNDNYLWDLLYKLNEINLLSECMVSKGKRVEIKNFDPSFRFEVMKDNLIKFATSNFQGYLSQELIYDSMHNILLDKNLVLMIKDILTGRFNSYLLISLDIEAKYSPKMKSNFKTLMELGDELILKEGNPAYDSIALLEPFCVNHIQHLADQTRPRIKIPLDFSEYIIGKVRDSQGNHHIFLEKIYNLIKSIDSPTDLTVFYGSFRLWGHPYIEYETGLTKLKEQVRLIKDKIDPDYAKLLANDLMKRMLITHFKSNKVWNVKDTEINRGIEGSEPLINNLWPKPKDFQKLEGHWDELEIDPILEIPEDLDDSTIFSDKTHSLNLDEILKYQKRDDKNPIPTKRVLKSYIESSRMNVKQFILDVNNKGLSKNDLVIGLKAKERELKRFGRFFTLMTWNLRLYFVISEYMIKKDFVKSFPGLTMADGYIDLINKVLDRTSGQRGFDYTSVTYANHIDYSKWNNHQRDEAVKPVFQVMDKCYGLENFISMTHTFFSKCTVYYPERPEFFGKDSQFYWEGQPGGFEGIRQKGWSIVGILALMRECKYRNTRVDTLVQGDNQLIFTHYKLPKKIKETEIDIELERIYLNNNQIMNRVKIASEKIGLIINADETVQSAGFSIYGKMPVFKGNILNLETKKVNRMSGITNDQLPTCANIMSSVNSTALAICQNDPITRNAIYIHLIYGIMTLNNLKLWNPMGEFGEVLDTYKRTSLINWLYHDQSLGGNTGMALTKLLIRRFPDPITEGLSFYKYLAEKISDKMLSNHMWCLGNPRIKKMNLWAFNKLLEDPTSLNIEKGSNILIMIKNQVKSSLIGYSDNIKNDILRKALNTIKQQEEYMLTFLFGIKPVFPRFLSDFKQSSICGYIDGVIGLVQNSKTIRSMFSHEFESKVRDTVRRWELEQWNKMRDSSHLDKPLPWKCSSSHADQLRLNSWRMELIGATVPHPFEYQRDLVTNLSSYLNTGKKEIITCLVPKKPILSYNYHGGITPYLGSNTKESSNAIQPWEKELTNPIFRKASNLRRGINWMISPNSKLAKSIYSNLQYMTSYDLSEEIVLFRKLRTGTALHRYKTSRQDNGGFCNITPNILSWFIVTSDYMTDLSDINYDFMYQASLIFTETVGAHILHKHSDLPSFGMGISCRSCIRPLKDIDMESAIVYRPQSISKTFWINKIHKTEIISNEDILKELLPYTDSIPINTHYVWGMHQAIGSTLKLDNIDDSIKLSELFSIGPMLKIKPRHWILGLIDGFLIGSAYSVLSSDSFLNNNYHLQMIKNRTYKLIKRLTIDPSFFSILKLNNLSEWLIADSNYIAPSYPPSSDNHSRSFSSHCYELVGSRINKKQSWIRNILDNFIIFNEFDSDKFKMLLLIGLEVMNMVDSDKPNIERLRHFRNISVQYSFIKATEDSERLGTLLQSLKVKSNTISVSTVESRVPLEQMTRYKSKYIKSDEYIDMPGFQLQYFKINSRSVIRNSKKDRDIECPFISGLRAYRCATGAHYKMNDILNWLNISPRFALIGGDGSGGMSSLVLRKYKGCEIIFNSLMEYDDVVLKGCSPGRPQAINSLSYLDKQRCINLDSCWMEPSDLSSVDCWNNFKSKTEGFGSVRRLYDLIILDMEARSVEIYKLIYKHLFDFIKGKYLTRGGYVITKCYTGIIEEIMEVINGYDTPIDALIINGLYTSSYSTEIYLVFRINRSIDAEILSNEVDNIESLNYSIRSDQEEFHRGLSIDVRRLYEQIPPCLKENYESYLVDYLLTLNIPPSLGAFMISMIVTNNVRIGLSDIIYYSTIIYGDNQDIVSSDQVLIKLICLLSSVAYFKAYISGMMKFYNLGNYLNNSRIVVVNSKVDNVCSFHDNEEELPYSKPIGPIRDNSFINLILRSLLGCYYTVIYDGNVPSRHRIKRFTTNILDLYE